MKKKICSLLAGTVLIASLSVPAFAATYCSCGGTIETSVHRTPWIGTSFVDCTHGNFYSKDALQERTIVTTTVCNRCGAGSIEQTKEERHYCYAAKSNAALPEGETCSFCNADAVVTETHHTPWLTVETDADGNSSQERTAVKTAVCGNCGHGTTTEETETRVTRLHG